MFWKREKFIAVPEFEPRFIQLIVHPAPSRIATQTLHPGTITFAKERHIVGNKFYYLGTYMDLMIYVLRHS